MRLLPCLCAALLLFGCAGEAPRPQLWDRFSAHDETNPAVIDNSAWNDFLGRYLHADSAGIGRLDYAHVSADDRELLGAYLRMLQRMPVSKYSLREQRAFWLNLYNAKVVSLGLQHSSGAQQSSKHGWFSKSDFTQASLRVEDQALSLDDIENRILRPLWGDARTEYALCKGRLGDPALAPQAFGGEYLAEQLEARARAFVNSSAAFRVESARLQVSALYRRYAADFGGSDAAILAQLRRYADEAHRQQLQRFTSIDGYYFDETPNAPD